MLRQSALVALLAVASPAHAFLAPQRHHITFQRQTILGMAAAPPPPPPPPAAATVVTSSTSSSAAPSTTASNLPSQKELLAKSPSSSSTASPSAQSTSTPASKSTAASTSTSGSFKGTSTGIIISSINYDGQVPKTESDEYVVITNNSKSPIDISNYYVYVATTGTQGPTFTFPKKTSLNGGESVRIYTNEIHKESGGYSFGSGKAVWSNSGGLAVLKDGASKKIGEFKYTSK